MLWVLFVGFFLICVGMSAVSMFYLCVLWYAALRSAMTPPQRRSDSGQSGGEGEETKKKKPRGLSSTELQMLPGAQDGGLGLAVGTECPVCLDDIESGQPARVLPTCGHAFHRRCADTWLSSNPACPVCRAHLHLSPPPSIPVDQAASSH